MHLVGQNHAQAVHLQRDTTVALEGSETNLALGDNTEGQTNREIFAKRDGEEQNIRETDPGLLEVSEQWDSLPEAIKNAILAMVRTVE